MKKIIIIGAIILNAGNLTASEISISTENPCNIQITGNIEKNDSNKLKAVINRWNNQVSKRECLAGIMRRIMINSLGGDVDEAIAMGNLVKDNEFSVFIRPDSKCFSSCVLVLAAGINRQPIGAIGIHRPYFSALEDNLTLAQIRKKRELLKEKIYKYFELMDINPALAEAMLQTPPEDIKILTESELKSYRLSMEDANFEEKRNAEAAKLVNLNSSEYRRKSAIVDKNCKHLLMTDSGKYMTCRTAILLEISEEQAAEKLINIRNLCGPKSNENEKIDCIRKLFAAKN